MDFSGFSVDFGGFCQLTNLVFAARALYCAAQALHNICCTGTVILLHRHSASATALILLHMHKSGVRRNSSKNLFKKVVLGNSVLCFTELCFTLLSAWICTGAH